MSSDLLIRKFRDIGVRACVNPGYIAFTIRVARDRSGEHFVIGTGEADVDVLDVNRDLSQLLIVTRSVGRAGRRSKEKLLCGRDERHLFAAAVPNLPWPVVSTVRAAHEALKPAALRRARGESPYRRSPRDRYIRQGDWFFVPRPDVGDHIAGARKNVRLGRAFGKSHIVEHLVGEPSRFYGWFSSPFGSGAVLARGFVRHPDHRTIRLRGWHSVFPNSAGSSWGLPVD
jgi:hypothetical protein